MLASLKQAVHNAGPLFAFVPEFYVEACIGAYSALKSYFTPSLLSLQSPGALFVCFFKVVQRMSVLVLFVTVNSATFRAVSCV